MFELPLFPLGSVLFPGSMINLHIFEERYKEMINLCLQQRAPFGVVLIEEGREALGPLAKPFLVGCTAQIVGVQPLGQGRMFIAAVGQERFRINKLSFDQPYLVGLVEPYPLAGANSDTLRVQSQQLGLLFKRYLEILAQARSVQIKTDQIPDEPIPLAYLSAAALQHVSQREKQDILASETAGALLARVTKLYRREVNFLELMLAWHQKNENGGPFSAN